MLCGDYLVRFRIDGVVAGGRVRERATIVQRKTSRSVQFALTEQNRTSVQT
jgi:hypothetical protein